MANPQKEQKAKESGGTLVPRSDGRGELALPFTGWGVFDRLMDPFFRGWPSPLAGAGRGGWGLEMREGDGEVVVRAEAPGFEPADFDVQVRGDQLVLCACHKTDEEKDGGHHWSRQEFYRSVTLPPGTDPSKVEARYRNGILTVKLPRTEESKGRKIAVQG